MARHPGVGTTLWGQPYGSPLDAWAAMPFVAVWGHSVEALRLPYFLLSLLLVPIAYALARELHPAAGLPAAVLVACPPPYFLLLAALPPPFYPTTLVLCGLILLLAARAGTRLGEADAPPPVAALLLVGALSGLALWTHLMSASVVAAAAGWLLLRARGRRRQLLWALAHARGRERAPVVARAQRPRGDAHRPGREPQRDDARRTCSRSSRGCTSRSAASSAPTCRSWRTPRTSCCTTAGWAAALTVLLYGVLLDPGRARRLGAESRVALPGGGGARARGVPVPGALGAAHDPAADAALSARGRARGVGGVAARGAAARLGGGARARRRCTSRSPRACSRAGAAPTGPTRPSCSSTSQPLRRQLEASARAPRLRVVRPRVPPGLGERRADRRVAALERPLPPLAAAAPRRGALREERRVGADAHGSVGAAAARRARAVARPARRALQARHGGRGRRVPRLRAALRARRSRPWPGAGPAGDGDLRTFVAPDPRARPSSCGSTRRARSSR